MRSDEDIIGRYKKFQKVTIITIMALAGSLMLLLIIAGGTVTADLIPFSTAAVLFIIPVSIMIIVSVPVMVIKIKRDEDEEKISDEDETEFELVIDDPVISGNI